MAEHPPPPVITITNPSEPRPLSDVIGREPVRAPRRLSRAQRGLAVLAAAAVGTAAAGVWSVGRIQEDRRLDRAAVREVHVVAAAANEDGPDQDHVNLALLNQGPHPVTVLSARLDVPGFPALPADANSLPPDNPQLVTFPLPRHCPDSLRATFLAPVLLRLRTYRGAETTIRFDGEGSTGEFAAGFVFTTMARCGVYPPEFSLETTGLAARSSGADLIVDVDVHNRSRLPRSLDALSVEGGLRLTTVGATIDLAGDETVQVQLRLSIDDCRAALGSWAFTPQQQGFTPTFRGIPGDGEVTGQVSGDGVAAPHVALLVAAQDDTVRQWVVDRCHPSTGTASPP
jgi:hypothetical protein